MFHMSVGGRKKRGLNKKFKQNRLEAGSWERREKAAWDFVVVFYVKCL